MFHSVLKQQTCSRTEKTKTLTSAEHLKFTCNIELPKLKGQGQSRWEGHMLPTAEGMNGAYKRYSGCSMKL